MCVNLHVYKKVYCIMFHHCFQIKTLIHHYPMNKESVIGEMRMKNNKNKTTFSIIISMDRKCLMTRNDK